MQAQAHRHIQTDTDRHKHKAQPTQNAQALTLKTDTNIQKDMHNNPDAHRQQTDIQADAYKHLERHIQTSIQTLENIQADIYKHVCRQTHKHTHNQQPDANNNIDSSTQIHKQPLSHAHTHKHIIMIKVTLISGTGQVCLGSPQKLASQRARHGNSRRVDHVQQGHRIGFFWIDLYKQELF